MKRFTFRLICFVLLIFQLPVFNLAQSKPLSRNLQVSNKLTQRPIERELKTGEVHKYSLRLEAGQTAEIIVDQDNIDVVVRIFSPTKEQLGEVNNLKQSQGSEYVSIAAAKTGEYGIEVRSHDKTAAGTYLIKLANIRAASIAGSSSVKAAPQTAKNFDLRLANSGDRTTDLALRLTTAETEAEGDALLAAYPELITVKLAEAIGNEAVRLAIAETPRPQVLLVFKIAVKIAERLNNKLILARAYAGLSRGYGDLGQFDRAIESASKSIALAEQFKNIPALPGFAYLQAGRAYLYKGENDRALEYLFKSISLFEKYNPGDDRGKLNLSSSYWNTARAYVQKGEDRTAVEYYQKSLPLMNEVGHKINTVRIHNELAQSHKRMGDYDAAVKTLTKSLSLVETLDNKPLKTETLFYLSGVYLSQGLYAKELETLQTALKVAEEIGIVTELGGAWRIIQLRDRIGLAYLNQGNTGQAYASFQRALEISVDEGRNHHMTALVLIHLGSALRIQGHDQYAFEYYQQAIDLVERLKTRLNAGTSAAYLATVHNSLGAIKEAQGDLAAALESYQRSLKILESVPPEPNIRFSTTQDSLVFTLNHIGELYAKQGRYPEALSYYQKAAAYAEKKGFMEGLLDSLVKTANLYYLQGRFDQAQETTARAVDLARNPNFSLSLFIDFARATKPSQQLWRLLTLQGKIYRALGNREMAQKSFIEAITVIESARMNVNTASERAFFFAKMQEPFEQYVELLMELHAGRPSEGYNVTAFEVSERQRARALLESLSEARAAIRQGIDPSLLQQEKEIRQQINARAGNQTLVETNFDDETTEEPMPQPQILSDKTRQERSALLKKEIDGLTLEYQNIQAQIRKQSPRYAALTQPQPLKMKEIQQEILDADTVLLQYALGEKKSFLWAVSKDSIKSHELPPRAEIETAVNRAYTLLSDGKLAADEKAQAEYEREATRLSRMLLAPVADRLPNKRILLVADGALQYLPFGALPVDDPGANTRQPLNLQNEIISLPSVSTLAVLRRETANRTPAAKSVAVLADPVFSTQDERLTAVKNKLPKIREKSPVVLDSSRMFLERALNLRSGANEPLTITRLPFSRREAEAILVIAPAGSSLKALDFKASLETALSRDLADYRIVHFATHGLLNSEHPELSGIVLSLVNEQGQPVDGFLRLNEIYNLNLSADLVVLSACQTALGKEIKGEGLIGLTRGFMYAGSPRVVASLWKVDDVATAELMKLFYQKMLLEKMSAAAALRAAKIEMRKQKRWNAPFYWAAFELQGEWR